MAQQWKRDRSQIMAWVESQESVDQRPNYSPSTGNLALAGGFGLAAAIGLWYYTSESGQPQKSLEQLGLDDEEYEEQIYLEEDDD